MCNDGGYLYGEVYVAKCARKGNMNCMTWEVNCWIFEQHQSSWF
jgi:hypothetical protein